MFTLDTIREIAYYKWEEAGRPEGQDSHFWILAKAEFFGTGGGFFSKMPLNLLASDDRLGEDFIREFQDNIDWHCVSRRQHLSEDFIREFQHKVNWENISRCQHLSEDFIREFQDKVDWESISTFQSLSEDFIREFKDKVIWIDISIYQRLSEDFIREFIKDELHPTRIVKYQILSENFKKELFPEMTMTVADLCKHKLNRKQKIAELTPYYEIIDGKVIAYKSTREDGFSFVNFRYQYKVGQTYESHCDCTLNENSFGLGAWTKENAIHYARTNFHWRPTAKFKLFKVEIDIDDIGAIVDDCAKLRCFKFKVIEEVHEKS